MVKKLLGLGVMLILVGIIFAVIQNSFYGHLDADGILHDSLFLPLSGLTILGGLMSLLAGAILFIRQSRITRRNGREG